MSNFITSRSGNNHDQELASKLQETKDAFSKVAHETKEAAHKAKETAGVAKDKAWDELKHQSQNLRSTVATYVQEKPLMAIGGAILIGAAITWLMRRR